MKAKETRLLLDLSFYPTTPSVSVDAGGGGENPPDRLARLRRPWQDPVMAHVFSRTAGIPFGAVLQLTGQVR